MVNKDVDYNKIWTKNFVLFWNNKNRLQKLTNSCCFKCMATWWEDACVEELRSKLNVCVHISSWQRSTRQQQQQQQSLTWQNGRDKTAPYYFLLTRTPQTFVARPTGCLAALFDLRMRVLRCRSGLNMNRDGHSAAVRPAKPRVNYVPTVFLSRRLSGVMHGGLGVAQKGTMRYFALSWKSAVWKIL